MRAASTVVLTKPATDRGNLQVRTAESSGPTDRVLSSQLIMLYVFDLAFDVGHQDIVC
ncbi:hypothetical protein D3C75_1151570 [compost metagenome]